MPTLTVYGASDDLIELQVEGARGEEFSWRDRNFLTLSDGTVLLPDYDKFGIWRFQVTVMGSTFSRIEYPEGEAYTERVIFSSVPEWVVHGEEIVSGADMSKEPWSS